MDNGFFEFMIVLCLVCAVAGVIVGAVIVAVADAPVAPAIIGSTVVCGVVLPAIIGGGLYIKEKKRVKRVWDKYDRQKQITDMQLNAAMKALEDLKKKK